MNLEQLAEDEFMPFKKNSKIKTMNVSFLKTIFRSEAFLEGYKRYLENFDILAEDENLKKVEKCTEDLVEFI